MNATPAGAADGDFLKLGTNGAPNASTQPTGLYYDNGPTYQEHFFGLGVVDHSTTAGVFDAEPAVGGVANKTNFGAGIQGVGTNGATGVVGKADSGIGVKADSGGIGLSASGTLGASITGGQGVDATSNLAAGGIGVSGTASGHDSFGVLGGSDSGIGMGGAATAALGVGVFAVKRLAGPGDALVALNTVTGRGILATDTDPTDLGLGGPGTATAIQAALLNAANASDAIVATTAGTGRGVNASSAKGIGLLAQANGATNTNAAVKAQSNGKGQAVLAANTAAATMPAVQASSLSTVPAVQATGKAVAAGGAVAAAGNAAAIAVQGVATFTRSGVATVAAAAKTVVVNIPGGVTAASHVLATMQTTTATVIGVKSATPNAATGKVTITLTAAAPAGGIVVAWFVFG